MTTATVEDVKAQMEVLYERVTNEYQGVVNLRVAALEEKVRQYSVKLEDDMRKLRGETQHVFNLASAHGGGHWDKSKNTFHEKFFDNVTKYHGQPDTFENFKLKLKMRFEYKASLSQFVLVAILCFSC